MIKTMRAFFFYNRKASRSKLIIFFEPPQGLSRCCQGTPFLTTQARGQPKVLAGDFWAAPIKCISGIAVIKLETKLQKWGILGRVFGQ